MSDGERILLVVEDIGRHNTLDRLHGECALRGIDPAAKVILSSGARHPGDAAQGQRRWGWRW